MAAYIVKYSKFFVDGHLKNLMVDEQASFSTLEQATEFVAFCRAHAFKPVASLSSNYTLHMARIETSNLEAIK